MNQGKLRNISPSVWIIFSAAIVKFLIHLLTGTNYGYFSDELYTFDLSKHLDFGYVDLPPLMPLLVAGSRALFGESLIAVHLLPAAAGAFTLVFACLIAKEWGGRSFAVGLTALAFLAVPIWLMEDSISCYDSLDQLVLAGFLFLLTRFLGTGNKRLWVAIGLVAGIAFLTKATILFLGPGFLAGILVSKYRRHFLTAWPWLGLGIFLIVSAPYVLWNFVNNWPTLAYWTYYGTERVFPYSLSEYLVNIGTTMNYVLVPLFVLGLVRIFRPFGGRRYYFFGILFLVTWAVVFRLHARSAVLAVLFIPLIAAGSLWLEELLWGAGWRRIVKIASAAVVVAGGVLVAPSSIPVLPEELLPLYAKNFGFVYQDLKEFKMVRGDYPYWICMRIGWEEMVKAVADAYNALPLSDRAKVGILTETYGAAGAINLLGKKYGLSPAACGQLNYHRWGPGKGSWDVMILVTNRPEWAGLFFSEVKLVSTTTNKLPVFYNRFSVLVCRSPESPPEILWPAFASF